LINQLYPENSFIDLFELKAEVYEKQFSVTAEKGLLEKALSAIDCIESVDMIRNVIAEPSKLLSIRSNKQLIAKGISILYELYSADGNDVYFEKARSLFNRSKSLLYNDKNRRNNLAERLSMADREKWAALQKTLLELYDKKFDKEADINTINGEILACQLQIDNIFSAYNDVSLSTLIPSQYIEYFTTDTEIYAMSELNDKRIFLKMGFQSEFQILANRLNEFILLKGMSLDESILNEMYRFLIKPLTDHLPDYLVIIPDGSIGYVPFEMLQDDQENIT
jgi:hypothetical protein